MKNRRNGTGGWKCALAAAVLGCAPMFPAAGEGEVAGRVGGLGAEERDDWDSVVFGELQWRYWWDDHLGLALAGGFQQWDAEHEFAAGGKGDRAWSDEISGDADVFPVGVSVLIRGVNDVNTARFLIEAGIRHASVDSSVRVTRITAGQAPVVDTIEIDDALLAVVAAELGLRLGDNAWLSVGVGYQHDFENPEETFREYSLGETDFSGVQGFGAFAVAF